MSGIIDYNEYDFLKLNHRDRRKQVKYAKKISGIRDEDYLDRISRSIEIGREIHNKKLEEQYKNIDSVREKRYSDRVNMFKELYGDDYVKYMRADDERLEKKNKKRLERIEKNKKKKTK